MSASYKRLLLQIIQSDSCSELINESKPSVTVVQGSTSHAQWRTRCLHCKTWLYLKNDGQVISDLTIEHIVPQAWFARKNVLKQLGVDFADANDLRNLALACARCNHSKGMSHDMRPNDERARTVILQLLAMRLQRFKQIASV